MAYTAPTFAQAETDLASRLNDQAFVHWTSAELGLYIREAIRTWNAWTNHFRDSGTFSLVMLQPFYDLGTVLPTLRGQSVTNWDLVTDMQYALLEPPAAGGTWTGTDQFTLQQLSDAIQRRRDMFLQQTGAILTRAETNFPFPAATGRLPLDEAVMTVRRGLWRVTATQLLQPLMRTDEWAGTHFKPSWPQATTAPNAYSVSTTPPLTLQLIPPAQGDGTLDLVSVNKGVAVDPLVSSVLGVPDDWAWVIKWGALSDLLQGDGLALDPQRASYCTQRWDQGIEMARNASVVLDGRINDVTVRISSLADADAYSPTWQLVAGNPLGLVIAGQNLIASLPMAGGGTYTVTLDVVRNAPVPVNPGDILQIGQDVYDAILDYAQHVALWKEGPGQLQLAQALLDRATAVAGIDLKIQQASQPSRVQLLSQNKQDEHASARESDPVPVM